jgi:L-amino acid N-acyltransferase YncA
MGHPRLRSVERSNLKVSERDRERSPLARRDERRGDFAGYRRLNRYFQKFKSKGRRMLIRLAREDDATPILAIYAPLVRETAISFEVEPPSPDELRRRIATTLETFPWLVAETDGFVAGFAYASLHRQRLAYQWAVDVSAYVHPDARRRGFGRALYRPLLALLTLQGFYGAFAGIALPNPGSVALHEAMGFEPVGVFRQVGYKLGAWRDVGWWQLELRRRGPAPSAARPLPELVGTEAFAAALAAT